MEEVVIHGQNSRIENAEMNDLLNVLCKAYGSSLPNTVERITRNGELYYLHMKTPDMGSAFGECLATNGWAVIGFHTHFSDDETLDRISVKRLEDCNMEGKMMYRDGYENEIAFEYNEE